MNRVGEGGRQSIVRVHFLLVVVYNLWKTLACFYYYLFTSLYGQTNLKYKRLYFFSF